MGSRNRGNGCLVGFDDQRFSGGEYRETPIDEETHLAITEHLAGL